MVSNDYQETLGSKRDHAIRGNENYSLSPLQMDRRRIVSVIFLTFTSVSHISSLNVLKLIDGKQ
jgi:hypothetical protein